MMLLAALVASQFVVTVPAQQQVVISGRVGAAMKLSVAPTEAALYQAVSLDHRTVTITLRGEASEMPVRLRLPLEIRTNVPFELKVTSVAGDAAPLRIDVSERRASGALTAAEAVSGSRAASGLRLERFGEPAVLLSGPRVSRGGNFTTPSNALLFELVFEAEAQANGWQKTLHISLQEAN